VIRPEVRELVALGALPAEDVAEQQDLEHRERLVRAITALLAVFGPDGCYGVAWSLLHLVETAPGWPLEDALRDDRGGNEWILLLRQRVANSRGGAAG
jgi:hypothetical protein